MTHLKISTSMNTTRNTIRSTGGYDLTKKRSTRNSSMFSLPLLVSESVVRAHMHEMASSEMASTKWFKMESPFIRYVVDHRLATVT